jgi:DNA-binding MarR family transcriptional regulator
MNLRREAPGPRYQALIQLLRTAEVLWNSSRVWFARWGLSPSQFNVLNVLVDQAEGLSQTELSRRLIMHRSNVTGLVDRLEERGLVQRRECAGDRRAYRVVLSAAGRRRIREILPYYYGAAEEVWGSFPVEQTRVMLAALSEVALNSERMAAREGGG